MKIHAICLTRNEADVIEHCLREAAQWADRIHVYDGASTDGTWERVQAMKSERIIPWRSDDAVFREGLRAEVFADNRADSQEGDWGCQLNADEFHVENPREILAGVPRGDPVVWAVNLQDYITHEDVAESDITGDFLKDRERLRYGDGQFIVEEKVRAQYREPASHRALKRFMHSTGLWP